MFKQKSFQHILIPVYDREANIEMLAEENRENWVKGHVAPTFKVFSTKVWICNLDSYGDKGNQTKTE